MRIVTSFGLVISACLLASCGGDDSGSGGSGGGTPPPPPPPPPVSYTKFADLTGSQTFQTTCAGEELFNGQRFPLGGLPFGNDVTIDSDRSGPSYTLTVGNIGFEAARSLSFTPGDLDGSSTTANQRYVFTDSTGRDQRFIVSLPSVNGTELEYARIASLFSPSETGFINLICAFGVPTVLNDVPSNSLTYDESSVAAVLRVTQNASIIGAGPVVQYSAAPSISIGSADPATGEISFTLDLQGFEFVNGGRSDVVTDIGSYAGETSIDGTQASFSGSVVNADNVVVGSFGGWFFGPGGQTMAFSYSISDRRSDDSEVFSAGVVFLR